MMGRAGGAYIYILPRDGVEDGNTAQTTVVRAAFQDQLPKMEIMTDKHEKG